MKFSIVLTILLIAFPLVTKSQTQTDQSDKNVIFYSKSPMYVKYKEGETKKGESSSTTLYIQGSAKFANGASIEQKGRTEITEDFINAKDPATEETAKRQLFKGKSGNDTWDTGVIAFVGKGVAYDDNGTTRYKATRQHIHASKDLHTDKIDDQKTLAYINFPTISVEKGLPTYPGDDWREVGYLLVDKTAALSVDYINAPKGNRFAIEAAYNPGTPQKIDVGYAKILNVTANTHEPTYSQVNLSMYAYDKDKGVDDGKFGINYASNSVIEASTVAGTLRTEEGWNRLTGFASPFEELGADYLFYHVLTKPHGSSITSYEGPIVDPFYKLQNGVGYFHSMEVSNHDDAIIDARWDFSGTGSGVHNSRRARGGHVFNRMVFLDYLSSKENERMSDFSRFLYEEATTHPYMTMPSSTELRPQKGFSTKGNNAFLEKDKKTGEMKDRSRYEIMVNEKFNTSRSEVVVELKEGLNFLGNPFMAPISLNPLLGYSLDGTKEKYTGDIKEGVVMNVFKPKDAETDVKISSEKKLANTLRTKYWLINEALIRYDSKEDLFFYRAKYDYISRDGSTSTINVGHVDYGQSNPVIPSPSGELHGIQPLKYLIAPMQMFCLQAGGPMKIKLDMNELCYFGKTNFLKSETANDASKKVMHDWFVVEVEGGNQKEFTSDRTSVIFRERALPKYENDPYDTRKGLSKEFDRFVPEYNGEKTLTKMDDNKGIVYTRSSDGENMLGNAVPKNTKELALFFIPPSQTQEMKLKFYGLDNIESVPGVWLIDRYLNNKTVKLNPGDEYSFVSDPSDFNNAVDENRFILRFYETDDIVIENNDQITCYYNTSTLYVKGLNDNDINSNLEIYDMQGRLIAKTKVNNVPSMEYLKPLSLGTYILKITGKRNYTSKFVNLR